MNRYEDTQALIDFVRKDFRYQELGVKLFSLTTKSSRTIWRHTNRSEIRDPKWAHAWSDILIAASEVLKDNDES